MTHPTGRYGFVLADAFALPLVACRGQLGFFTPPMEALAELAAHIRQQEQTS